ncbi:unnamed protein product [Choristocarpus tenellus]
MEGGSRSVQDEFFRRSMQLYPDNTFAVRSYGYRLEQSGRETEALQHYVSSLNRTPGRLDLKLLIASVCSPHLDSSKQGTERYVAKSKAMHRLILDLEVGTIVSKDEVPAPGKDLIFIPSFSWPYLGFNMRPLMESMCSVLVAMAPGIHGEASGLHPVHGWREPSGVTEERDHETHQGYSEYITIGVVMERSSNSSPHNLLYAVLKGLSQSKFQLIAFAHEKTDYPPAGVEILEAADRVITMPWHPLANGIPDTWREREVIAAAKVDVLMYMALGNTLGSHLLALGRLAPVQLVFGHGHPVTSGSLGIDYFISSTMFETNKGLDAREARRLAGSAESLSIAATAAQAADSMFPQNTSLALHTGSRTDGHVGTGDSSQDYTEQVVSFDTLSTIYKEAPSPNASDIAFALQSLGLQGETHLYHCMQHSKKLHPDFDLVIKGVLSTDLEAKILLLKGSKVHLPRWRKILDANALIRLVFTDYLEHPQMMALVAGCQVMLDTFPWGAGVTSSEALSLGVPVVTLPSKVSVLQLALGQLLEMDLADELVAKDVDDMVGKAVELVTNSSRRVLVEEKIGLRKKRIHESPQVVEEWERFLERAVHLAMPP